MKLKKKNEESTGLQEDKNKKKITLMAAVIILTVVLFAAAITGILAFRKNGGQPQMQAPPAMAEAGENVISASGLTSVGMSEEMWELDFLETELYVDESFLLSGDTAEAGTAVFHVSEETLNKARKELEDALTQAELSYRQGVIDYETDRIDARSTYEKASVNQKYAQDEYNKAAALAAETVEDLEKQVEEARELVEEYTRSVNEDYYRSYYKVDELYQNYYEHFSLLMSFYEKWDVETLEDLSSSMTEGMSGSGTGTEKMQEAAFEGAEGETGGEGFSGNQSAGNSDSSGNSEKLSVYDMLDELVTEEGQEYKAALKAYEEARDLAAASLDQAVSSLSGLEAELAEAQTEYEKGLISCKADYEITLAESQNARIVYETTLQSLEETLSALEAAKTEAEENLALFEEIIGDGYFYTESAGTIVMNGIREGTCLSGEALVIAYNNPETVTITANVDQSDIADIAIGDSAYVAVSEYGNYQGTVTVINPVTMAESRSSVTYQVTVSLEGDISNLDSNLTAYVYFGVTDEMLQQMEQTGKEQTGVLPRQQEGVEDERANKER